MRASQYEYRTLRPKATSPPPPADPEAAVDPPLEALYDEFQPLVRRLIRQFGENQEMRQDLEGEIYTRFSALVATYDAGRGIPFRAYMVRMLTASVYTYSRSLWRRQHREVSLEACGRLLELTQLAEQTEQWNAELHARETARQLPQAIAQLPTRQRQVVVWRYYESRSFEEIAEMLEVRPATARSLLRHAINNLRGRILGGG